ncbi:hypothetical protein SLA2020_358640 [Shorea laevis]
MGALARNHEGEVLAAMACRGQGLVTGEVAEANSLRRALQWARDLAFANIVVEIDCANLVTAVHSDTPLHSSLGFVIQDCKGLISSFASCRLQHVRRVANAAAHELAKRALQAEADEYWTQDVPDHVALLVAEDRIAL